MTYAGDQLYIIENWLDTLAISLLCMWGGGGGGGGGWKEEFT